MSDIKKADGWLYNGRHYKHLWEAEEAVAREALYKTLSRHIRVNGHYGLTPAAVVEVIKNNKDAIIKYLQSV